MIIAYRMAETLFAQTRLRQDALQCFGVNIISWVTSDRNAPDFRWVLELSVTSHNSDHCPAVAFKEL